MSTASPEVDVGDRIALALDEKPSQPHLLTVASTETFFREKMVAGESIATNDSGVVTLVACDTTPSTVFWAPHDADGTPLPEDQWPPLPDAAMSFQQVIDALKGCQNAALPAGVEATPGVILPTLEKLDEISEGLRADPQP